MGSIAMYEPIEVEGYPALRYHLGDAVDGNVEAMLEDWGADIIYELIGPQDTALRFHVRGGKDKCGPIFLERNIIWTPFIILGAHDVPLHCDECVKVVTAWMIGQQYHWSEEYHGDWYAAFSQGGVSKEVH